MPRCYSRLGQRWVLGALLVVSMLGFASTASAQFDRGSISGTIKDASGGVVPGVTVTATSVQTQTATVAVTDAHRVLHVPEPAARPVRRHGRARRLQEDRAREPAARRRRRAHHRLRARDRRHQRAGDGHRRDADAADRRRAPQGGRRQGHRAAVVLGPQPDRRGQPQGRRRRRLFNTRGFGDLGNGGFNINGSRSDENNITVDGATAIRTRSSGDIVGIQNVDAIQEVQVLTANYMPEFGRASGGQIRFVTKSGSNRFSGSGSFFYRDDKLHANTWSRNRSPNPIDNSGPAPFDYKQYGYSFGGPIPVGEFKDKLFFFGAQEWVNFFRDQTRSSTVPTDEDAHGRFQRAAEPGQRLLQRRPHDHATRPPGSRSRTTSSRQNRLSPEWHGDPERVSAADAGLPAGHEQRDHHEPEPAGSAQGQHPVRLPAEREEQLHLPLRPLQLDGGGRRSAATLPYARTDWERPNTRPRRAGPAR